MDLTLKAVLFPSRKIEVKEFIIKERKDLLRKVGRNKWKCEVSSAFPYELYKTACVS